MVRWSQCLLLAGIAGTASCGDVKRNTLTLNGVDSIKYTESRHVISDGEEWESMFVKGNQLVINAGRHKTEAPGDAFVDGLDEDNMFSSGSAVLIPGRLNFATFGTMSMKIGNTQVTCDLRVAQGHNDATLANNWWVAGSACTHDEVGKLRCDCGVTFKWKPNMADGFDVELTKTTPRVVQQNALTFNGVTDLRFTEKTHTISPGELWSGLSASGDTMIINASRHKTLEPSVAFSNDLTIDNMFSTSSDDLGPGYLNFETEGQLSMKLEGVQVTCDVRIAQGHIDQTLQNNWWIAGPTCHHTDIGKFKCQCGVTFKWKPGNVHAFDVEMTKPVATVLEASSSANPVKTNTLTLNGATNLKYEEFTHVISDGQPWKSITVKDNQLVIEAARHKTAAPGIAFRDGLTGANMISTISYDMVPGDINFVTMGWLTMNIDNVQVSCDLRIAQGHNDVTLANNWWIASPSCHHDDIGKLKCKCGVTFKWKPAVNDGFDVELTKPDPVMV